MLFDVDGFYVDLVEYKDLDEIVDVYNSNKSFLMVHLDAYKVDHEWLINDIKDMKEAGFYSCKIIEGPSQKIVGIMDFKLGEETYLSLLMIHDSLKGKGLGKLIYKAFEEYAKLKKSKFIKIDVVTNYDKLVVDFWINNGFVGGESIKLSWGEVSLDGISMKKGLN